jgi:hypothetical protein
MIIFAHINTSVTSELSLTFFPAIPGQIKHFVAEWINLLALMRTYGAVGDCGQRDWGQLLKLDWTVPIVPRIVHSKKIIR